MYGFELYFEIEMKNEKKRKGRSFLV